MHDDYEIFQIHVVYTIMYKLNLDNTPTDVINMNLIFLIPYVVLLLIHLNPVTNYFVHNKCINIENFNFNKIITISSDVFGFVILIVVDVGVLPPFPTFVDVWVDDELDNNDVVDVALSIEIGCFKRSSRRECFFANVSNKLTKRCATYG